LGRGKTLEGKLLFTQVFEELFLQEILEVYLEQVAGVAVSFLFRERVE